MDDPAFMLLQLQENLRFIYPDARLLSCLVSDENDEPYWTYVVLVYDHRGRVKYYVDPEDSSRAKWTNQPLEALRDMHLNTAAQVTDILVEHEHHPLRPLEQQRRDEAAERSLLRASNGSRRGPQQTMAPISASCRTPEYLGPQSSDHPPAHQSQKMSAVHVQ